MTKFNKEFFERFSILYGNGYNEFSCKNGWYDLLFQLSEKLNNILKNNKDIKIQVDQVKSKFGGLCFYYTINKYDHDTFNLITNIVIQAESKSYQTCEYCGKNGATQKKLGWITTMCDDCFNIKQIIE